MKLAEESLRLFNEESAKGSEEQDQLSEELQTVKDRLYELAVKFEEAKLAARDSIDTQIGLFEELALESDWSAEKIIQNWESQRLAFDNYAENLKAAVDMGLDEALVQQLSDGSAESMQILNALVRDTDISIDEINASFARTEESRDTLAATMAGIHTDVETELDAIVADAKEAGVDIASGAAKGINDNAWRFIDSIVDMASDGIDWFEEIFDINSPSRVMRKEGPNIVGGAAGGIDDNVAMFERSMENLASSGYDAFLQERIDRAESYPDMVNASSISNSATTTNYGGFTFQIYQQPGESAEDLYYRMMDMMQHDVAAKEAALQ